jgi:ribose 5-phosphate isomerase B
MVKLLIASDHGGYSLKEHLKSYFKKQNYEFEDLGTHNEESVDYPIYASRVAKRVPNEENTFGILICGTGIGISIAANKHKGIRAALVDSVTMARLSREHNNANILCMGGRTTGVLIAEEIIDVFINTKFEGGRHQNRIDLISGIEK